MPPYPDYQADLPENRNVAGRMLARGVPSGLQLDLEVLPGMHVGIGGWILIATLRRAADRMGVETRLRHRVTQLVTVGDHRGRGGYPGRPSDDPGAAGCRLHIRWLPPQPATPAALPARALCGGAAAGTSTGDFVGIAGRVGAQFGNMTHAW
jgi:hypothetical protein